MTELTGGIFNAAKDIYKNNRGSKDSIRRYAQPAKKC